jgi:hypothetical protein
LKILQIVRGEGRAGREGGWRIVIPMPEKKMAIMAAVSPFSTNDHMIFSTTI